MKTIAKRLIIALYCREIISVGTAQRLFSRFKLWGA